MLEQFFKQLPQDLKLDLRSQDLSVVVYKHEHFPITLTIYPTTMTVLFQGNILITLRFTQIFEKIYEEHKSSSSSDDPVELQTSKEKTNDNNIDRPIAMKKRNPKAANIQVHNLRFNDFRDDLLSFISKWKPINSPSQINITCPETKTQQEQSTQTDDQE